MKKLLFLSVMIGLLLSVNSVTHADVGLTTDNFPSEEFCTYLSRFDLDSNGSLSDEECSYVTEIELNEMDVYSLEGIKYFPMLERLDCQWNHLQSLDLSHNPKLSVLYCNNNPLISLDLNANTELTYLYCHQCHLISLDVRNCIKLRRIECEDNRLTYLGLSSHPVLQFFDCKDNALTTLDVSGLPSLDRFRCERNELTSLILGHNTALISLTCDENHLTELDITGTPNLHFLGCNKNDLTSLDLSGTPKLEAILVEEYKDDYPALGYYMYTSPLDWEYHFCCDYDVQLDLAGLPRYAEPEVHVENEYLYYSSLHYYVIDNGTSNYTMTFVEKGRKPYYASYMDPLVPETEGSSKLIGASFAYDPNHIVYLEPGDYEAILILTGEGHRDTLFHYDFAVYNPYLPLPEIYMVTPDQPDTTGPVSFYLNEEYEKIEVQLYRYVFNEVEYTGDYEPVWDEARIYENTDTISLSASMAGSYKIEFTGENGGKQTLPQEYWFEVVEIEIPEPDLVLPENTKVIEDEAFHGIENVVIRIPGTVESVSESAFNSSVTILAPAGSAAAEICRTLGLNVMEEG